MRPRKYARLATQYAKDVVSGKMLTGELAALACERHLRDLDRVGKPGFGFFWSEDRAERICRFIELLPHVKGTWPQKTIRLQPWQCFSLCSTFGWVDQDGHRRFRRVYEEIARKNSKTTTCAGIALYLLTADGEPGAEVYSAAVTRDQAKISWGIADQMVRQKECAELRRIFGVKPYMHHMETAGGSIFRPLAHDSDSLEGLNVHGAVIDELHAHKSREVYDVLDTATGSRKQPLIVCITTAGDDQTGIGYEVHGYIEDILRGVHEDDRYWGTIYSADKEDAVGDGWTTDEAMLKANPNFGVSVFREDIEAQLTAARRRPAAQAAYRMKRLNLWDAAGNAYFDVSAWGRNKREITLADVEGKPCVFAVDLASVSDIEAFIQLFQVGRNYVVFGRYYLPEKVIDRTHPNYDRYRKWQALENFVLTPGERIDHEFIETDLREFAERLKPREICYDPYQAADLATRMEKDGHRMVRIDMNVRNLSQPMKNLEALITEGRMLHDGDPILQWMVGNVLAMEDRKENVYPRKGRPDKKIDGAVALIMGLSRTFDVEQPKVSVYSRGIGI